MAAYLSPIGNSQAVDGNGAPLSGGFVFTYAAGTSTALATYTDSAGLAPQANPIVLNSLGLPSSPIWLPAGRAVKLVVQNAASVTQRTVDNVLGINDPATITAQDQWVPFTGTPTYINATSFSLAGDQTNTIQLARRLKTANSGGTIYSTVASTSYNSGTALTTVTVNNDSGTLDSGLSQVSYGLLSATNPSAPASIYSTSPYRNRTINGSMLEDQRNSAAAQTFTAAAALAYCVDRFYGYCTGANVSGQQVTASAGSKRYRFTGAASVTAIGIGHRYEAVNTLDMAGNPCTFSVKLSNTLLTTVSWAAYYANTADTFGTLASPTRTAIASGTFTVSSTEAVYSAQLAVPAAATTGIEIVLTVGAQTSGTWTVGEWSFEKGSVGGLSFELVDVALNKARCQRYYELVTGAFYFAGGSAAAFYGVGVTFKTEKRAAPTVAVAQFIANTAMLTNPYSEQVTKYGFRSMAQPNTPTFDWNTLYSAAAEL